MICNIFHHVIINQAVLLLKSIHERLFANTVDHSWDTGWNAIDLIKCFLSKYRLRTSCILQMAVYVLFCFTACTLYSWSYCLFPTILSTLLILLIISQILENEVSTFFIPHHVESRRCAWQNKHLFENPWVGAHSVRTENHCLSTQSVRVWFAVLTIGDASPRTKDFLPNVHLSCASAVFGPFGNLLDLSRLNLNMPQLLPHC